MIQSCSATCPCSKCDDSSARLKESLSKNSSQRSPFLTLGQLLGFFVDNCLMVTFEKIEVTSSEDSSGSYGAIIIIIIINFGRLQFPQLILSSTGWWWTAMPDRDHSFQSGKSFQYQTFPSRNLGWMVNLLFAVSCCGVLLYVIMCYHGIICHYGIVMIIPC